MKKINPILQVRYEGIGYKGIRIQPYFPIPLFLFIFIGNFPKVNGAIAFANFRKVIMTAKPLYLIFIS